VCIIWKGRVSSGAGEYHMDKGGCYLPEGEEYHLEKHANQVLIEYYLRYHLNVSSKRIFLFLLKT
jgi:hypothetical protein